MTTNKTYLKRRLIVGTVAMASILGLGGLAQSDGQTSNDMDLSIPQAELIEQPTYLQSDYEAAILEEKRKWAAEQTTTTTSPPTTTTVVPSNVYWDTPCQMWLDLAVDVGWENTEEVLDRLGRVIWKESRCQSDAWNGHDAGLTQINQIHTDWAASMGIKFPDDLFDPATNLRFALALYESREEVGKCGWKPWSLPCLPQVE
jgi:hypothetical protein